MLLSAGRLRWAARWWLGGQGTSRHVVLTTAAAPLQVIAGIMKRIDKVGAAAGRLPCCVRGAGGVALQPSACRLEVQQDVAPVPTRLPAVFPPAGTPH